MRNPSLEGVNYKEVIVLDKHSSKNKNVNININILTNATFSGKKSGRLITSIIALAITGIVCYKLFTMSESGFVAIFDSLLEMLSSIAVSH